MSIFHIAIEFYSNPMSLSGQSDLVKYEESKPKKNAIQLRTAFF